MVQTTLGAPLCGIMATLDEDEKWSSATLCIYSEVLTDEEIGTRLGLKATRTHVKGQSPPVSKAMRGHPSWNSSARLYVYRDWAWFLSSPLGGGTELASHLGWLLDAIEPRLEALRALFADCKVRLFCGFSSGNGQGGFTLDSETLERMAKLGLPFVMDLYPPSLDNETEIEPE